MSYDRVVSGGVGCPSHGYVVLSPLPCTTVHSVPNRSRSFAEYGRFEPSGADEPVALTLVTLDPAGTHIAEKVSFVQSELFAMMGFPPVLAGNG